MSNIVNLKYDNRIGDVIFALYPKSENYKSSILNAIEEDRNITRVNEVFKVGDSRFLNEFPELIGLINNFGENPRNIKVRIDRVNNKLEITGETSDGTSINIEQSIQYADNSGTYKAIDNSELGSVGFFVTKQNVERLLPFFSVSVNINGVDQNGSITSVSFDGLKPLFIFDRNVIEAPLVNQTTFGQGVEFSRQMMDPDFNLNWVNATQKSVLGGLFEEVEFVNGDYYITDGDVLIKTTIEKDENQNSISGLNLNITSVSFKIGMDRVPVIFIEAEVYNSGDYTNVIQNTLDDSGKFRFFNINNLYLNNESILENATGTVFYSEEKLKTFINISYSSKSIISTPRQDDTLFITFDSIPTYSGTPPLNSLNFDLTSYNITNYEIINGGSGYEYKQSFETTIYNGFEETIIKTELTNGNWSISQSELTDGFFYRMELSTNDKVYSFRGFFERVGNKFKYVQTPNDNISFPQEPVFMYASSIIDSKSTVIRPDRFLLQNIVLTSFSNNLDLSTRPNYDGKLIVDNQKRTIGIIAQEDSELTSEILQSFVENPAACIECTQMMEQTYLINRNTQEIAVISKSGESAIYNYEIIEEVQ